MRNIFFILAAVLFSSFAVFAQGAPTLVINEIAYRGTVASATDEWIELFNAGDAVIDLSGWKLFLGDIQISLKGSPTAKGYFLLERTNDQTISDIPADQIYTGAMNDNGVVVTLQDPAGNTVDRVSKWFVKIDRQSMERLDPLKSGDDPANWVLNNQTLINGHDAKGNLIMGTPKSKNSADSAAALPSSPALGTHETLRISRVLPNPEGRDEGIEWIELENISDQEIALEGFRLDNREGASKPYSMLSIALPPKTVKKFFSQETGIELRNSGDQARLFSPRGELLDQLEWKNDIRDGLILERKTLFSGTVTDTVSVLKVIDGDTLEVKFDDGTTSTVRMIGIDAPESVHPTKPPEPFGKESSEFLRNELLGKTAKLEYDDNRLDEYGRLLAYVFLETRHINAELIQKGFARAYLRYPFKYSALFSQFEQESKQAGAGMWRKAEAKNAVRSEAIPQPIPSDDVQPPSPPAPSFLSIVLKKLTEWLRQIYSTLAPRVAP